MFDQLQRAINLSQKTGDKLIVFDSRNPKNSYVLIPFDEYERSMSVEMEDLDEDECECGCCGMSAEADCDDCEGSAEVNYENSCCDYTDEEFFQKFDKNEEVEKMDFEIEKEADIVDFNDDYEGESDFSMPANNDLTEEEQIDKINRVLSMSTEDNLPNENIFDKMDFLEGNFGTEADTIDNRPARGNHWNIPKNIKEVAEEVIEEDRHYLEEITF